jgi:DNA-binding MarR family transcriptional regulator
MNARDAHLRFDGSIWVNLYIAADQVGATYQQILDPLGLSVIELYILRTLYEEDGQLPSRLARSVGRPATSFTPILDKIVGKGLVERRPDPTDRRSINVYLTDKATHLRPEVEKAVENINRTVDQTLPEDKREAFERVILQLQQFTLSE